MRPGLNRSLGAGGARRRRTARRRGARGDRADRRLRRQHRLVRGDRLWVEPLRRLPAAVGGRRGVVGSRPGQRRDVRAVRQRPRQRRRADADRAMAVLQQLAAQRVDRPRRVLVRRRRRGRTDPTARAGADGRRHRRDHLGCTGPVRHGQPPRVRRRRRRSNGSGRCPSSNRPGPRVRSGGSRCSACWLPASGSRRSGSPAARSTRSPPPSKASVGGTRGSLADDPVGLADFAESRHGAARGPGRAPGRVRSRVGLRRARRAGPEGRSRPR